MTKKILATLLAALALIAPAAALEPPDIDAAAAIMIEKSTGEVLFELNPDGRLPQASITKVMTAILALEYGDPEATVTVAQSTIKGLSEMNSATYLIPGEEIAFMDLLRYVMIASGNDGSNALAEHVSGSIEDFVALMNTKAQELGMTNTQYKNTHGLTQEGHYTSARDTAVLCMYAMENPVFAQIAAETEVTLPITNKHAQTTRKFTTNYLLSTQSQGGYKYEGALGIKTGHTTPAGRCLASAVRKDDLTFYTVVLGAQTYEDGKIGSFTETIKLFDYGKANFSMQTMLKSTEPIVSIPLRLATNQEELMLQPESSVTALLPKDFKGVEDLELTYEAQEEGIDAPVEQGQVLGTLTVRYDGRVYATMNLVASESVERSDVLHVIDRVTAFFTSTLFKVIVGVIIGLIVLFVIYVILVNRRRRKRRQRYGGSRYK